MADRKHSGLVGVCLSALCHVVRNILEACALIIQVLQDHITPIVEGSFRVGQQREQGVIHPESFACLRVTQPQLLRMDSREHTVRVYSGV